MVDRAIIDEIRMRNDIVEVIGEYLPLQKVGRNYRALCPFHSDTHPSFYVSPEKQIFYCFGCQKGGNIFTFLMEYEGIGFYDALKKLGAKVGIEIKGKARGRYEHLYELNEIVADIYHQILHQPQGKVGLEYLHQRGITDTTIEEFKLGFAPTYARLIVSLERKGYRRDDLLKGGLIIGTHRELFRNRVIFPITNPGGRVVAFGGRAIDDQIQPKYLNSPETPIFKKRANLFGLSFAKRPIIEKQEVMIVEGYFDLLMLYQNGYRNVVAPLGTALTQDHGLLLSRYTKKALIIFDADPSGIAATIRSIGQLLAHMDVRVVELPPGTDPDAIVRDDPAQLRNLLDRAVDFIDFIRLNREVKDVSDEVGLITDLLNTIGQTKDPIRFDRYLKRLSMAFGISEATLKKNLARKEHRSESVEEPIDKEAKLLFLALQSDEYLDAIRKAASPQDFTNPSYESLKGFIFSSNPIDLPMVIENLSPDLKGRLLRFSIGGGGISLDDYRKGLYEFHLDRSLKRLQAEASRLAREGRLSELKAKQREIEKIKKNLLSIEEVVDEA
ncbi:DNA primase [candidate division WOR-3 bacterium]|uniref:DNA primase n=1 Tax=candidate division WOR-3 bacterium TaxID=2052148 RepID=A0A660SKL9_UNCW3|nr:MAG: DNA primase [candidate division WOR-3 bacterium]